MSEYESNYSWPMEVWDPALGRNVYTGGQHPTSYITQNPDHYQGYTGAVTTQGNFPLTLQEYAPSMAPTPTKPRKVATDPNAYGQGPEGLVNYARARNNEGMREVPGVYGVGLTQEGQLADWGGQPIAFGYTPKYYDPNDEVNQFLVQYAQQHDTRPIDWERVDQIPRTGRWRLQGTATPEEQRAINYLRSGGRDPRAVAALATARGARYHEKARPVQDQFFRPLVIGGIGAGFGVMTGGAALPYLGPIAAGALGGASASTVSQGIGSGEINPYQVAIGAGAGAAGGAASQFGVPNWISGPTIGAGSGAATSALKGDDPFAGAARGAAGGAAGAGLQAAGVPSYIAGPAGGALINGAWPTDSNDPRRRRPQPRNPYR